MSIRLPLDEYHQLCLLLHQTSSAMLKAEEVDLKQFGISATKALALLVVQALGTRATTSEISRWLFRRPHSVSGLLSRMEKDGLVRRVTGSDSGRKTIIMLTDKGKEAHYKSLDTSSCPEILRSLSDEDRKALRSYLETLRNEALKHVAINLKPPFP